ncbi:enolase C-terminal domain-like protein [Halomontanus rarus]|uniref:enolase C-terminal domain-like protein n=1 Tax=Halomontanus rarus TaxID=3034020 RepID=UPI001A99F5B3
MNVVDTDVLVTCPGRNYVLVKLETDDGLVGWGDATLNGRERAVEAALDEHVLPELVGRDARRIEDAWQSLFRHTYWRGGPVLNSALSGVDMALWDLKGKSAGVPVFDLLGGRTREYANVYQHCGAGSVEEIVENCETALGRGIDHLRINLHAADDEYLDQRAMVDAAEGVREALGPDPELLIDVHGRARPIDAADLARRLEPVDLFFLEDPIRPENPEGFETVREGSTTPLAMGELFANPWEMLPLVERELVDFVRVDLAHVGGITAAKKLATVGEFHDVRTAFHGPPDLSPVGFAATVHLDLALPNFGIQELTEHDAIFPDCADVFDGGARFLEGTGAVDVADDPGLGIDVDEDVAREFEYERSHLPAPRNEDGSVQDW